MVLVIISSFFFILLCILTANILLEDKIDADLWETMLKEEDSEDDL